MYSEDEKSIMLALIQDLGFEQISDLSEVPGWLFSAVERLYFSGWRKGNTK